MIKDSTVSFVSDQYGRKRVVTVALSATSLAIFFLAFMNIRWLFVVFLGIVGFFLYSLRPVLLAWTMETAPKELGGSAVGVQFSFQSAATFQLTSCSCEIHAHRTM